MARLLSGLGWIAAVAALGVLAVVLIGGRLQKQYIAEANNRLTDG